MAESCNDLARLFEYLEQGTRRACGFECSVDEEAALEWLRHHKPELAKKIEEACDEE